MKQQFVWLAEHQSAEGAVWATANHQWTKDASEAAWFVRKQDAQLFCWNFSGEAKATEHSFIG